MDPFTTAISATTLAKAGALTTSLLYTDAKLQLSSDWKSLKGIIATAYTVKKAEKEDRLSAWYFFERTANAQPDEICYICEGEKWTWREVKDEACMFANYLISLGIKRGDSLSLLVPSTPLHPIIFLSCALLSIIPAFLNTTLPPQSLKHCIKISNSKILIYDGGEDKLGLEGKVDEIAGGNGLEEIGIEKVIRWEDRFGSPGSLGGTRRTRSYSDERGESGKGRVGVRVYEMSEEELLGAGKYSKDVPGREWRTGVDRHTPACLIYTSGTTGLPKAAICTHARIASAMALFSHIFDIRSSDRIYTCLPLYHSAGSFLCLYLSFYTKSTVIISPHFSASGFWNDVKKYDATVIQYIGEICRYLLANKPNGVDDKKHKVRMAYGNGLRPDIWEKFRERFGIPIIAEFFTATEAPLALFNKNTGPFGLGAVGRRGALINLFARGRQAIIKVDPITEEPIRDKNGFCIKTEPNEPGEVVGIIEREPEGSNFSGYHGDKSSTNKKIVKNCFADGDEWFRSGDLLKIDENGFIYFVDRLGDTFRWHSENVSTTEVAAVLGEIIHEANVFGVQLPNHEGRAGCAAIPILLDDEGKEIPIDLDKLAKHSEKELPGYARPLFLRFVKKLEQTGTVKQMKVALRTEGVDPSKVQDDQIFWLHPTLKRYVPFTSRDWEALKRGGVKL